MQIIITNNNKNDICFENNMSNEFVKKKMYIFYTPKPLKGIQQWEENWELPNTDAT